MLLHFISFLASAIGISLKEAYSLQLNPMRRSSILFLHGISQ
ncbi:Hypothetical protein Minf_0171 [Methylacidiphilum infernorum V4]|uniref:Uncharacterized protein n=1 Tax=Methylacidiphilum infernorum (isolate V4) TaxID=481448 RepID=B3DXJ7_METI4|nr:Hypothetical protein Minf_0171 [Methylacidiphilum infernorum V4]